MFARMSGNIPKFYAYSVSYSLFFILPIYAVFFLSRGLSLSQVLMVESVMALTALVLEIPTGYLADARGRKFSLILAGFSFILAIGMLLFAESFLVFMVAGMLSGLGMALRSGADSAFVYDTLLTEKKERKFPKIWGRVQFIVFAVSAIASVAGGWMAGIDFLIPITLTLLTLVIGLLFVFSFKEPLREKPIMNESHLHNFNKFVRFSISHPQIRMLLIYTSLFAPLVLAYQFLVQLLVVGFGLPLAVLGLLYAALLVFAALGHLIAAKFYSRSLAHWQLFALSFVGGAALLIMSISKSPWALLLLVLPALAHGISRVIVSTLINDAVPSDKRATVLSVQGMAHKCAYTLLAAFTGIILAGYSLKLVLIIAGLLPLAGAVAVLLLRKAGQSTFQ